MMTTNQSQQLMDIICPMVTEDMSNIDPIDQVDFDHESTTCAERDASEQRQRSYNKHTHSDTQIEHIVTLVQSNLDHNFIPLYQ